MKKPVKIRARKKVKKLSQPQREGKNIALKILRNFAGCGISFPTPMFSCHIPSEICAAAFDYANLLKTEKFSVHDLEAKKLAREKNFSNVVKSAGIYFLDRVLNGLEQAKESIDEKENK